MSISYGDRSDQQFNCFYFSNKLKPIQPCIIYLHGLSSYCFEGLYLLQQLQGSINLCLYDLRGHGKNKCNQVTYGLREASDLCKAFLTQINLSNSSTLEALSRFTYGADRWEHPQSYTFLTALVCFPQSARALSQQFWILLFVHSNKLQNRLSLTRQVFLVLYAHH